MIVTNCLKTSRIIRRINKKPVINFNHIINYSPRVPFTMILVTGVIKLNTTPPEGRLDSTHKRPSYLLTGTYPSPRSVSAWRSAHRSGSLLSTWRPAFFIHWSLTGKTEALHWVVPRGRSLLAQRPRCRFTVKRKGSILCVVGLVTPK